MTHLDDVLARLKSLHPLMIDLSLGRIERLLGKLGDPQSKLPPVVHIAGTNGKGSVTAMLRAMAKAGGLRVHAYTSPHLIRFNERIVVAGARAEKSAPISEPRLIELLERVERINGDDPMTFFEITTAAAFLAFAEAPADVVLLEVGLGGRLDATNVIAKPRLTIITPVSMDHADKLGDTVAKIAAEKSGIMKRGVTCVVARQDDEAAPVIEAQARRIGARLIECGQHYDAFEQSGRLVFQSDDELIDLPLPALVGSHQIGNAGVAVAAALQMADIGFDVAAIEGGLKSVEWPARMQRLNGGPLSAKLRSGSELWLDGGHNPSGAAAISDTLASLEDRAPKPIVLVMGLMGQKDARGVLSHFRGLAQSIVTVPIPGAHEQPFTPEALASLARELGIPAQAAPGVAEALALIEATEGEKRILICGSLYLAGHVLAMQEGVATQTN